MTARALCLPLPVWDPGGRGQGAWEAAESISQARALRHISRGRSQVAFRQPPEEVAPVSRSACTTLPHCHPHLGCRRRSGYGPRDRGPSGGATRPWAQSRRAAERARGHLPLSPPSPFAGVFCHKRDPPRSALRSELLGSCPHFLKISPTPGGLPPGAEPDPGLGAGPHLRGAPRRRHPGRGRVQRILRAAGTPAGPRARGEPASAPGPRGQRQGGGQDAPRQHPRGAPRDARPAHRPPGTGDPKVAGAVELRQLPDPRPAPPPSMLSASRRGKFFWNKHRELRLDGPGGRRGRVGGSGRGWRGPRPAATPGAARAPPGDSALTRTRWVTPLLPRILGAPGAPPLSACSVLQ